MNTGAELKALFEYFLKFIRTPIDTIKTLPPSPPAALFFFQWLLSATFGALTGLSSSQAWHVWVWLIALPTITMILCGLIALALLLTFKIFMRRDESFEKLYRLVFVSVIPFLVLFPILNYLPPLFLVCCVLTALLLIVGLVENFQIPQGMAVKIVGLMAVVFVLIWILNQIQSQEGLGAL